MMFVANIGCKFIGFCPKDALPNHEFEEKNLMSRPCQDDCKIMEIFLTNVQREVKEK
jgi:hypothetical protein